MISGGMKKLGWQLEKGCERQIGSRTSDPPPICPTPHMYHFLKLLFFGPGWCRGRRVKFLILGGGFFVAYM